MTNENLKSQIINDYINGLSILSISKKYRKSSRHVSGLLKENNIQIRPQRKYSEESYNFIKEFYPENGAIFCAEKLNMSKWAVKKIVNGLKIKKRQDYFTKLIEANTKEAAYVLGVLWGDACISKTAKANYVLLGITYDDLVDMIPIFAKVGKWNYRTHIHPISGKKIQCIYIGNKILCDFLRQNDYHLKSGASAKKILSVIPKNLHYMWWLGYADADGCIFSAEKNRMLEFAISGFYDQNWDFMEDLYKEMEIKYFIKRNITPKRKFSIIRIFGKLRVPKFTNYIYQSYTEDKIGFPRKYERYLKAIKIANDGLALRGGKTK